MYQANCVVIKMKNFLLHILHLASAFISQGPHSHILMTGGPKDFFGSDSLAKRDFFGSQKQQRDFFGIVFFISSNQK